MNNLPLFEKVVLCTDVPEGFRSGDVGVLLEYVASPEGKAGAVLEFFDVLGRSVGIAIVPAERIEPLKENEIPCVRRLGRTA